MDAIGNEVGQKMRSAIKAKLTELGCYVDDELPDYIMVMIANRRSRTQMDTDLELFLGENTKLFVDWLQQVLKKLKEVKITNPDMYPCSSLGEKRKTSQDLDYVAKKERKEKKLKIEKRSIDDCSTSSTKMLSDDIPVKATALVEKKAKSNLEDEARKKTSESLKTNSLLQEVNEDNFDIPSLSEVNLLADSELDVIEDKIKKVKNRLVMMKSDSEDEDFINMEADTEELLGNELCDVTSSTNLVTEVKPSSTLYKRVIHLKRSTNDEPNLAKNEARNTEQRENISDTKPSMQCVDKKTIDNNEQKNVCDNSRKTKINLTKILSEEREISGKIINSVVQKPSLNEETSQKKESVHARLGIPSSVVALPKKIQTITKPAERASKTIPSVVQVKPRRPVTGSCQANKNLLLKAIAEAQRSVSQIPPKATEHKKALFTKKYRQQHNIESKQDNILSVRNCSENIAGTQKENIVVELISEQKKSNNSEYIPLPDKSDTDKNDEQEYNPSAIDLTFNEDLDKYLEDIGSGDEKDMEKSENPETCKSQTSHQFIVTLDGINSNSQLRVEESASPTSTTNIDNELPVPARRVPSPIIFNKEESTENTKPVPKVPNLLAKPSTSIPLNTKERCKYWPACRLGDFCEYIHPSTPCKVFPHCKFGDRCLYIHPNCKFFTSCTRKDCPYSHGIAKIVLKNGIVPKPVNLFHNANQLIMQDTCKYFPNCTNSKCHFYHPRPCKFGINCLNKSECPFSHSIIPNKEKLTWHSNAR